MERVRRARKLTADLLRWMGKRLEGGRRLR